MSNILLVIDMQNDFINGSLGSKEAEKIVPNVIEKVKNFKGDVYFTRDTHDQNYLNTQEGKKLPVLHCLQGSKGWEIREEIDKLRKTEPINKSTFGSIPLAEFMKKKYEEEKIQSITLIGISTDICVISNAMLLKAYVPEVEIIVDGSCCAGVTPESHKNALNAMKLCQITIIGE